MNPQGLFKTRFNQWFPGEKCMVRGNGVSAPLFNKCILRGGVYEKNDARWRETVKIL